MAARMEKLEKEYAALNIVPIISKNGTPKVNKQCYTFMEDIFFLD